MKKIIVFLLCLVITVSGCQNELINKNLPNYAQDYPNTPRGNFDAFWHGINTNYVFFDIDPIDWDVQYETYVKQIRNDMSKAELQKVLSDMAYPLIDGHFTIKFDSSSVFFSPEKNPHPAPEGMFENLLYTIPQEYLDAGSYRSLDSLTNEFLARYGTIHKQVQYVAINAFAFTTATNGLVKKRLTDFITNPPAGTKGIILDLRVCAGGSTYDANLIPGLFTDKPVSSGSLRFKPGPGRYEYGPLLPFGVTPSAKPNLLPCVILVDQLTYSCGEFTSLIMSQFPQVTVMGAKTYGAMGDVESPNITLPNGWGVQTALCAWKFTDGLYHEGKGVVPDVALPLDVEKLKVGVDNQLEAAIKKLLPY